MKRNTFRKILVAGIIILFLSLLAQPITSIDIPKDNEIVSSVISGDSILEEECNCPDVDSSGRPLCDLLLKIMDRNELRLIELAELLEKYENNPIIGGILGLITLSVLYWDAFFITLWELFKCYS